jgi:hypothetical protein
MNRRRADWLGGGLAVGRRDRSGRGNENEDPGPVQELADHLRGPPEATAQYRGRRKHPDLRAARALTIAVSPFIIPS